MADLRTIDWAALSLPAQKAAFDVLQYAHADVMSHVRIAEGVDNTALFEIASTINAAMHDANDELARRDALAQAGDPRALR